MECPQCHFENREAATICNKCGQVIIAIGDFHKKLNATQEKLQAFQRYLPKGLPEKILSQIDKIEGERRQVTVMCTGSQGYLQPSGCPKSIIPFPTVHNTVNGFRFVQV